MNFKLHAIVARPDPALIEAVMQLSGASHVTRSGLLVVSLYGNRELSHELFPEEWGDTGGSYFRYKPNFTGGTVHEVYDLPAELEGVSYRLMLEAAEAHCRGSYCQVVAGPNGERLRPYRRESDRQRWERYVHPTASIFSAPALGMLRLDANAVRRHGTLTIRRAGLSMTEGRITVVTEQLLRINDPNLAVAKLNGLPTSLAAWEPALRAHYERWECEASVCDGHFHLD